MSRDVRLVGLAGLALLGSALVVVGTWLAWPAFSPLSSGGRHSAIVVGTVEWGYQPRDLPVVVLAVAGGLAMARHRRRRLSGHVGLVTGVLAFLLAVAHAAETSAGPFVLVWGYNVTLGGAGLLAVAGVVRTVLGEDGARDADHRQTAGP